MKPKHDGAGAAHREALAEEEHREQARPDRHHELDREHGRERQHDDGVRPAQVGDEMRAVADEVHAGLAQRQIAEQRRLRRHHDEKEAESADGAHHEELEQVEHAAELTDRNRHQRKREQRADHPEDGGRHIGLSRRRLLGLAQCARLDGGDAHGVFLLLVVTRRRVDFRAAPCRRRGASDRRHRPLRSSDTCPCPP